MGEGVLKVPENALRTRRVSSQDVTPDLLAFGGSPAVVIPASKAASRAASINGDDDEDDDEEFASAIAVARHELEGLEVAPRSGAPKRTRVTDHYAFAFDIDGVLIKGGEPISQAVDAIKMLNGHNSQGIKVYDHLLSVAQCHATLTPDQTLYFRH